MKASSFKEYYADGKVQISSNVSFSQRDIIEKNYQMRSGQYEEKYFSDGTEKLYYNVVHGFVATLKRGSKLKMSELGLKSMNGKYLKMIDVLRGALVHHLTYNGVEETKDEISEELIAMGHVLTKIVDGEVTTVDLRRFIFKPNAKSVKYEGGQEQIPYTYEEAKSEYGDSEQWSEIEAHWEKIKETTSELTFVEHWTIDEFENEKGKKEITKGCIKYLDRSETEPESHQTPEEWDPMLEVDRFISPEKIKTQNKRDRKIYGDEMRVFPYDEQRLITIPGRYLGMGAYELCRPGQEDYNEKRNFKRKFDRLALRGILVHKIGDMRNDSDGEALTQEFLKRLDTGGALKIFKDESLERLNIGSTTGDTIAMTNDLFEFMRFMLGVTPVAIGQAQSNKTASFAVIQNQNQQTTYQEIKNKVARLFERIFQDFLLEDVIEDILSGDVVTLHLDKEDKAEMDRFVAKTEVDSELRRIRPRIDGDIYNELIELRTKTNAEQGESRYIEKIDKGVKRTYRKFLKEMDWLVKFNITDEAIDPNVKIDTILRADQMENEKLRDIVLEEIGISPKILKESDAEKKRKLEEQVVQEQMMTQAKTPIQPQEQPLAPAI